MICYKPIADISYIINVFKTANKYNTVSQVEYSLLRQLPEETGLLQAAKDPESRLRVRILCVYIYIYIYIYCIYALYVYIHTCN